MAEHGTDHGIEYGSTAGEAERHGPHRTGQLEHDVSKMHTTLLSEPPEESTLPRTQRLPVPPPVAQRESAPRVTRPQLPNVTHPEPQHAIRPDVPPVPRPERTNYLTQQTHAPLALPELPGLPPRAESGWLAQHAVGSYGLSGPISEADAAEAARWRRHADEVSEQIQFATAQFAAMTARWRTLVHMTRRTEQEDAERVRLEVEVPRLSQRLARARKRWTECLVHAREYEERTAR